MDREMNYLWLFDDLAWTVWQIVHQIIHFTPDYAAAAGKIIDHK